MNLMNPLPLTDRVSTGVRAGPAAAIPGRVLLAAELWRWRVLIGRYPWETAISLVGFAFMFIVFVALGRVLPGQSLMFGNDVRSLAVLYVLWTLCIQTISAGPTQIGADATIGVLENLFLSTAPIVAVVAARAAVHALQGVASGALLLLAFCLGLHWLPSVDVLATLLVAVLACGITSVGLAMAFAGIALLSKRATMLSMPVNFLCIVAVGTQHAAQFDRIGNPLQYVPLVAASTAVRRAVEGGGFEAGFATIALVVSIPCMVLGHLILARCAMSCRRAGTTSVY